MRKITVVTPNLATPNPATSMPKIFDNLIGTYQYTFIHLLLGVPSFTAKINEIEHELGTVYVGGADKFRSFVHTVSAVDSYSHNWKISRDQSGLKIMHVPGKPKMLYVPRVLLMDELPPETVIMDPQLLHLDMHILLKAWTEGAEEFMRRVSSFCEIEAIVEI